MLKSQLQYVSIRRWGFGNWLSPKGGALLKEISVLIKETPESSLVPSTTWGPEKKKIIYKSGSGLSYDTKLAGVLIQDFPVSRTMSSITCLLSLSQPAYCILLQEQKGESESHSVMSNSLRSHGILEARILEWVAIFFSRGSPWLSNQTQVSCTAGRFFIIWAVKAAWTDHNIILPEVNTYVVSPTWAPKSLQMVIAAMKSKDAYSLEGKLWPT